MIKFDLEAARAFFRSGPFMVDLGIEPVAVGEGRMTTALELEPAQGERLVCEAHVVKASATMALTAAKETP
jgi:acyl-coenzyme A thioesterase PaaI-like protein